MGRVGKISSIKKEYNRNNGSLEASLATNGYSRFPGTFLRIAPAKEPNQLDYKTGLNIEASYMQEMKEKSPENYKLEVKRITELKKSLETKLGISLDPRAPFYTNIYNDRVNMKVQTVKLKEGDNVFNLDDPFEAITYEWLRVHPLIASSYSAYERGEYPSNTQFYVNDDNIEETIKYNKKILVNRAIGSLEALSLPRRQKVARLLGLPVSDNSKEVTVYNVLDTFIKSSEIKVGDFKGGNPIDLFIKFAEMDDKLITTKGGRITEGGQEIAKDKASLVDWLMEDKNQDDYLALQDKLKVKKSLLVNK